MDSAHLTPAEREALRRQVLAERHPHPTEVEYEVLAEPSPPPSTDTPWNQAKRRVVLLGEIWGPDYTRWWLGSYREDDLTKARRRRVLAAALDGTTDETTQTGVMSVSCRTTYTANGAAAMPGNRADTIHTPLDASSRQRTTGDRQKGAA